MAYHCQTRLEHLRTVTISSVKNGSRQKEPVAEEQQSIVIHSVSTKGAYHTKKVVSCDLKKKKKDCRQLRSHPFIQEN